MAKIGKQLLSGTKQANKRKRRVIPNNPNGTDLRIKKIKAVEI